MQQEDSEVVEETEEMLREGWEESRNQQLEFQEGQRERHVKCSAKIKTEKPPILPFGM